MESGLKCESCGMPIPEGKYCEHCVDEAGNLQPFEERFGRMVQWISRSDPTASRESAEERARQAMRTMPAWKDHPKLKQP
jgi:hypothetical protein